MLRHDTTLAEVEEYIECCELNEMEKAGLWMLAWAHQDQDTQLRLAKEMLALVSSLRKKAAKSILQAPCTSLRPGPAPQ